MKKIITGILLMVSSVSNAVMDNLIFNVEVNQPFLTITPNVNFNYPLAGIKINSPGFTLQNQGVDCTPSPSGYCLFATGPQNPKTLTVSGQGDLKFEICANGQAPLNCQNYQATVTGPQKSYITSSENDSLLSCDVLNTGLLSNCVTVLDSSDITNPAALAVNKSSSKIYIGNEGGSLVTICDINPDGQVSGCQDTNVGLQPAGLAYNPNANV